VLTRFIYSLAIGISLLLTPQLAYADEVLIELTSDITYVDTVVEVTGPTEYVIETFTGPRFEQQANGTVAQRTGWIDSWIQLRQGETVLKADDDSNHVNGVNEYASKITGTVDSGTYTIRATSYLNVIGYGNPTGNYILNSNLIQPVAPTMPLEPVEEPPVVPSLPPEPVSPPIIPFEPPLINDIVPEEPPVPVEEPPAPAEEPPIEPEIAPVEEELPPAEVDTPPTEEEAPPAEAEEPPIEAEEPPPVVTEDSTPEEVEAAVEAIIEAADGEAITVEAIQEAGLTLDDLPSQTPVEVRTDDNGNAVVITAEVAIALQVFDSPTELVSAIFDNPGQVLTAVANIGADMSDEEREESEEIIVASVIAGQAAINAAGMAAGTATRTPTPSSPAGGPMAGNDKPKSARRRKP
jgi:hypothetical protein